MKINQNSSAFKLQVNNITLDQDNSILCASTNRGYRVYENNSYKLISDVDDYQDLIGNIQSANTLYKSRIVCFFGVDTNQTFPNTQLVIWDDFKRSKLGILMLKEMILGFKLTKTALFIIIPQKILLFELVSLKFVCSFEDCNIDIKKMSVSLLTNPIVLASQSGTNKSLIKVTKIRFSDDDHKLTEKFHMMIIMTFVDIQTLEITPKGDMLAVISRYGNKIHIYSLEDFKLKFCLFLTIAEHKILNLTFNNKSRFLSTLSFDGEDLVLNIYDVKNSNSELCECDDHLDSQIKLISNSGKKDSGSFFGRFVSKITNSIFSDEIKCFASGRIKIPNKNNILTEQYILAFHHFHKDLDISGQVKIIKFDKKNGGQLSLDKLITWLN